MLYVGNILIAVSHAEAAPGLQISSYMSSGIPTITYLASEFCKRHSICSFWYRYHFSQIFTTSMVSNFCKVIHCKGSSFSIKKNNVFQNTIIVLTYVSTSIYIVKFEKKKFKMEEKKVVQV
jgi:hypothetical protein